MRIVLKNSLISILLFLIGASVRAEPISLWTSLETGKGIMKEKEEVERIKGKDLIKGKLYLEYQRDKHLWDLGLGISQFKMLDTFTYKSSSSYESNSAFIHLANRYLYDNNWAVGVASEYYFSGIRTGNNTEENFFLGFDSTYDVPGLKKIRINLSLMNGTRFGSHQILLAIFGLHFKFN